MAILVTTRPRRQSSLHTSVRTAAQNAEVAPDAKRQVFGVPGRLLDRGAVKCAASTVTIGSQSKIALDPSFGYRPLTFSKRALCTQIIHSAAPWTALGSSRSVL
jgi:hypothetical protein